jgi:hypothetical protein
MKHKILEDCQRFLNGDYVKEIHFRVREFEKGR